MRCIYDVLNFFVNTLNRHSQGELLVSYQIRQIAVCACAGNAGNVFSPLRVSDADMQHGTCVTALLTSGFLWSRRRGKRSRHCLCMRNPQFLCYLVSGPCDGFARSTRDLRSASDITVLPHTVRHVIPWRIATRYYNTWQDVDMSSRETILIDHQNAINAIMFLSRHTNQLW